MRITRKVKIADAGVRPGRPGNWKHTVTDRTINRAWKWVEQPVPDDYNILMKFNHVIPWSTLWYCWNRLASFKRWEILVDWAYMVNLEEKYKRQLSKGTLDDDKTVKQKLCWPAWNIVEGPLKRYQEIDYDKEYKFDGFWVTKEKKMDLGEDGTVECIILAHVGILAGGCT